MSVCWPIRGCCRGLHPHFDYTTNRTCVASRKSQLRLQVPLVHGCVGGAGRGSSGGGGGVGNVGGAGGAGDTWC